MRSYSKVCCDASLVIRLHDPRQLEYSKSLELWERWAAHRVTIIAPMLLRYEIVNAVYRQVRYGQTSEEIGLSILDSLAQLPINYVDTFEMHREAFEFARRFDTKTSYDGHYVALARREATPLYTADKKLVNVSRTSHPFVHYVMDE